MKFYFFGAWRVSGVCFRIGEENGTDKPFRGTREEADAVAATMETRRYRVIASPVEHIAAGDPHPEW